MSLRSLKPNIAAPVGLMISAVLILMGLHAGQLPLINPSRTTFQAQFSDASGLRSSDAVEVAGVVVGQVTDVAIKSNVVLVRFTVRDGIHLGTATRAAIKIGDLLGSKYLEIDPAGSGALSASAPIPLARTKPAYNVGAAFQDLTRVTQGLDTTSIAHAFDVLSGTFQNAPAQVSAAIKGLSALSHTVASRDASFRQLMAHAATATAVLDQRRNDVVQILTATNLVLKALQQRKQVVDQLLRNTANLASQLQGLVAEDGATITPALKKLSTVTAMLARHQGDLASMIANMSEYVGTFNNVVGSGPWFDVVIPRLPNSIAVQKR